MKPIWNLAHDGIGNQHLDAESLNLGTARGALVAGVDDKGPARPAGLKAGDVIVKFDGKDIREMRDLPRVVADTTVGKAVEVVIIRKGQQETRTVTLGRLEDGEKQLADAKTKSLLWRCVFLGRG